MHSERAPLFLKLAAWGGVLFLHFPILIIAAYAFNTEEAAFSFPPQGLTLRWFSIAAQRSDILDAVTLSLKVATLATFIALVLGTLAAAALWRRDFFGKSAISLLLLLPIALPGIVTGLALLTAFKTINLEPGLFHYRGWSCDFLRGGRLQQCHRPFSPYLVESGGSVNGSWSQWLANLPLRGVAESQFGVTGGGNAGVCLVVR